MSKSLVNLVSHASELETALVESGGEITPEIESLLEIKDVHLPDKIDGYAMFLDRMELVEAFYKAKAEAYLRLAKAASNVIDRCESNLKFAMNATHQDELIGNDFRYKLVKSNPAVIVEEESKLDESYKITEVVTKIDKKKIAEDLKLGVPVEGARLEQSHSLRRYANAPGRRLVAK